MNYLILHKVALPITEKAGAGAWIDALDYYPNYLRFGGHYTWGGYVSWLLKQAGEQGFKEAMNTMGHEHFRLRYEMMPVLGKNWRKQVK